MKQLLILLLVTSTAYGQKTKGSIIDLTDTQWYQVNGKTDTAYIRGDTLDLGEHTSFKFIKIGSYVYQLVPHNTTIEKAHKGTNIDADVLIDPDIFSRPLINDIPLRAN